MLAKKALQRVFMWVFHVGTYFSFSGYVNIHTYRHLAPFCSILCATAACIAMHRLDIDTSIRVVFSQVFLKSTGYLVSQIKNRQQQTIFIVSIFSCWLQTN